MRGRIGTYAGVQLRDYLVHRAPIVVLVTAIGAWAYATYAGVTAASFDPTASADIRAALERAFHTVLATFAFAAAVLSAHGLVAWHRHRGYDRVYFSRPVDPVRYYAQGFVLAGVVGTLIGAAAAEVYGAAVHNVSLPGVAAYVGLGWLTIGGLAFLLTTLTRFHAVVLAALLAGDFALDRYASQLRDAGSETAIFDVAKYLLPPGHVVASLAGPFSQGFVFDPRALIWPVTFGVLCIAAALIHLRKRPFGS
jgi:hypothetical protein